MDGVPELAIIVPALNEASSISGVIAAAGEYGLPIVVDDGSTDDTAKISRACGAEVVSHDYNRGYDTALDTGFKRAAELGCSLAVTMDADGQHNPELLASFVGELKRGVDVVIGIRDKQQRIGEHVFAFVTRLLWGIDDPLCGMKGYRMELYRERGHFDSYGSIGTELALYAVRNHYQISQIPIRTRERLGMPRFGRALAANRKIFRALILAFWRTRSLSQND